MSCPLAKVEFDKNVLLMLENEGFRPDSVPAPGQTVLIQPNGNLAIDEERKVSAGDVVLG